MDNNAGQGVIDITLDLLVQVADYAEALHAVGGPILRECLCGFEPVDKELAFIAESHPASTFLA